MFVHLISRYKIRINFFGKYVKSALWLHQLGSRHFKGKLPGKAVDADHIQHPLLMPQSHLAVQTEQNPQAGDEQSATDLAQAAQQNRQNLPAVEGKEADFSSFNHCRGSR